MELRLSTTSAKLLDSEVKAAALPPPSLLSQRQSARFVVRDAPSTPVLSPQTTFVTSLIGSVRPDDLVPALLLLQSWLGSATAHQHSTTRLWVADSLLPRA
ncbi:hypothetical protein TASIC1_0007014700 [Trichoderma asperellum]|uniref:Uncharacterized protein n=1 Tax=Trichoderma asperellum TaxID=101201 RepID=A0A6V8QWP1_TRIAP|nr:hypothetical protein TASIC1_0007014700 [Trichoderma asperellum]